MIRSCAVRRANVMALQAHCAIMPCESQPVVIWAIYATQEAARGAKSLVDGGCPSGRRSMTSVLLVVAIALNGLLMSRCRLPKVQARDDIIAQFVFVCIYNLSRIRISSLITLGVPVHTSLVDVCSHLMFFAVTMCTSAPLSMCRISMKLGSNARM